jgi:glycosyltransferase involved in cell wall biosynthesis
MEDLISVVIANYNGSKYLSETLESVIGQTYPAWELIVVDDGSTDESVQVVRHFTDRFPGRIRLFQNEENKGVVYSRNRGADGTYGRYLAFLDADDAWEEDKLEKQMAYMKKASVQACVTGVKVKCEQGIPLEKKVLYEKFMNSYKVDDSGIGEVSMENLLARNCPLLSSLVVTRDLFNKAEKFEKCERYNCEDEHFFYKAAMLDTLGFMGEKLTLYRLHTGSYSYKVYYGENMEWNDVTYRVWKKLNERADMFPSKHLNPMKRKFMVARLKEFFNLDGEKRWASHQ